MIRSTFSLVGITGAVLLLCRRRLTWVFLIPWAALQTWVHITDPSGPWFFQSLWLGWTKTSKVTSGPHVLSYEGQGVNFFGLIWLVLLLIILACQLFPPLQPMPASLRWTRRRVMIAGAVMLALAAWLGYSFYERYNAPLVISTNYPGTAVYYRDQLLGRTPLSITPQRVRAWGLPLNPDPRWELTRTDWTQRVLLFDTDRDTEVVLDLRSPFYAPTPKPFPTPWGERHISLGDSSGNPHNLIMMDATDDSYPSIEIELKTPPPYSPGQVVSLQCEVHNLGKPLDGFRPGSRIMFWSFDMKWADPRTDRAGSRSTNVNWPDDWSDWPTGTHRKKTIDVTMPDRPGNYTLMTVFKLFEDEQSKHLKIGSLYSNYLLVQVSDSRRAASSEDERILSSVRVSP